MFTTDRTVLIGTIDGWCSALLDELAAVERELWLVVAVTLIVDVKHTDALQHGIHEGPRDAGRVETCGIAVLGLTRSAFSGWRADPPVAERPTWCRRAARTGAPVGGGRRDQRGPLG